MAIETVFTRLGDRLRELNDALADLRLTVVEDRPIRGDVALIDLRSDAIDDLIGGVAEAIEWAGRGQRAVKPPARLDLARQALVRSQEAYNGFARRYRCDLVSYERMAELAGLARERGREWQAWASSVERALRQCEPPLHEVNEALFAGWREISARTAPPSVSVRTTSIGQKVTMSTAEHSEHATE